MLGDANGSTFSCTPNDTGSYVVFTENTKLNYFFIGMFFALLDFTSLILNSFFLWIFYKNKNLWKCRSYVLYFLLVCSDLIICVFLYPPYVLFLFMRFKGYMLCELQNLILCLGFASILMSLVPVVAINIDLYIAIAKPYSYNPRKDMNKISTGIIFLWLVILTAATLSKYFFHAWKKFGLISGLLVVFLCVMVFSLQVRVSKEIGHMKERERTLSYDKNKERLSKTHRKSLKLAFAVAIIFTSAYLPSVLMLISRVIVTPTPFVNSYIFEWFRPFSASNVLWNPILYYYRMKSIRREFFKTICCKGECETVENPLPSIAYVDRNHSSSDSPGQDRLDVPNNSL